MNTLYLDLFSGLSGDMFIGALIDLGVDPKGLECELRKLRVGGYHLHVARRQKSHLEGVKFDVHLDADHPHAPLDHKHEPTAPRHADHHHHADDAGHDHGAEADHHRAGRTHGGSPPDHDHPEHRTFSDIRTLIQKSRLSPWVKSRAVATFARVAAAEGRIHGLPPDEVHFHEVGALDSIVDIVGACIALEALGKPRVEASPVTEGVGWVQCAHGRFPVPTPATLAILGARGIGVTQCEEPHELVTPTGAALLAEFAERIGPMQGLVASRIGYGLGTRDNFTRPNVLRAILGHADPQSLHDWETDTVAVLETNLDDLSAEVMGHFLEQALAAGALDVFHTPVQMKKNRPGTLLTLLCPAADADRFSELILKETTAFGVRRTLAERRKLRREFTRVKTRFGDITVKLGRLDGKVLQAAPEYESCRQAAAAAGVPVREVFTATLKAARR